LDWFFEATDDLILITDRQGAFIRVSPSSRALLGYTPEEMVGQSAVRFVFHSDLEATRAEMRAARRTGTIRRFICRYAHRDGHTVDLEWVGSWHNKYKCYVFIGRNVTQSETIKTLNKLQKRIESLGNGTTAWRYSDMHLIEWILVVWCLWAAWVLNTGPSNFADNPSTFVLVLNEVPLSEHVWGGIAFFAACVSIFGLFWDYKNKSRVRQAYLARFFGFLLGGLIWLPLSLSAVIGNPDALFSFIGIPFGLVSFWGALKIGIWIMTQDERQP
jgi:PAS domain S-box-containing protein